MTAGVMRHDLRSSVAAQLRLRTAQIEEQIFARVNADWLDRVGSDDPEYVAGLQAAGAAALGYALAGIERWGAFLAPVPAEAIQQAQRAAHAGVALETVLRRYIAGHAVLEDCILQEAECGVLRGQEPALREVLQILCVLLDRLCVAVSSAYNKERVRRADAPERGVAVADPQMPSNGKEAMFLDARREEGQVSMLAGMRRERILRAVVELAGERGFANTSVSLVTARAGVSPTTFYAEFSSLRDCFLAVLDMGLHETRALIEAAFARAESWQDGVLSALASLLVFFESRPALTRVWFIEAMSIGSWALERRERIASNVRLMIIDYWVARGEEPPEPVAAMGVMASILGLIQNHLLTEEPGRLIDLLGPLMGLVTPLYLDRNEVAREIERGTQLARSIQAGTVDWALPQPAGSKSSVALPPSIANPAAHRLRECVLHLAEHPGTSNRAMGEALRIPHKSQISKLLAQLAHDRIAVAHAGSPRTQNAWRLTPYGDEVAQALREATPAAVA